MNYVFLSPHFPDNFYQFCVALRKYGVTILGLADEYYYNLRPELRDALIEYFKVEDMHNYDQLLRALGYFTFKYGKIDRIDSQNEYWLETEAKLRTDFNIPGIKLDQIQAIKCKSKMKQIFIRAGVSVARGKVLKNLNEALEFVEEVGYPIVAKPDKGVGAADTFKIENEKQLKNFFEIKPKIDYIFEEYIKGQICSFDGLTDKEGNPLFFTSHVYQRGIMETVNDDLHIYYYSLREIPEDLIDAGLRILKAFEVKERFFHFEFFKLNDGRYVALEVNMRPPGGLTTDMFNYACDFDIYKEFANMLLYNSLSEEYIRKYHVCYVGRKFNKNYSHSHDEILKNFGSIIAHHQHINSIFGRALGDYGYILRYPTLNKIFEAIEFIHKLN